jgi:hypothetical protein
LAIHQSTSFIVEGAKAKLSGCSAARRRTLMSGFQ